MTNCARPLTEVKSTLIGAWPSGKAPVFGTGIRGFESLRPSQYLTLSCYCDIIQIMNSLHRVFGRQATPSPEQVSIEANEQVAEQLPLEFVDQNRDALLQSSALWAGIYSAVSGLKTDQMLAINKKGLEQVAEAHNAPMPESQLNHMAKRATADLSVLCFLVARSMSGAGFRKKVNVAAHYASDLPGDAHYVLTRPGGPKEIYGEAASNMSIAMEQADKQAASTLSDFTKQFSAQPAGINALSELYETGADKIDPAFGELREVIRTDWHTRDSEASTLRHFLDAIRQDENAYLNEFIDLVVEDGTDKKLSAIRNMAQFALAASASPETPDNLRSVLFSTRPSWNNFDDISRLFGEFRKQKLSEIETSLNNIAGLPSTDNPRLPKAPEDVEAFKRRLGFDMSGNRDDRRKRRAITGRQSPAERPNLEAAVMPEASRFDRTDKVIFFAKNVGNHSLKKEASEDDTIESFIAARTDDHLVEDMLACVKKINESPIDKSSRVILSGAGSVLIDGKKVRLRRFKPFDAQGLNISKDAGSMRICYGIIDGSVVITDILTHDQFDRKYV